MSPAQIDALVNNIGDIIANETKTEIEFKKAIVKLIKQLREEADV